MGSSVLQLVAYGAQDIYLTGKPEITYFKAIHKRHTNFAKEEIEIPITGSIYPGSKVSITISRNGDLLKGLTMQYKPNKLIPASLNIQAISSDIGHALIDNVDIEIGGQLIDRHYGIWLSIWRDLTDVNPYSSQWPIYQRGGELQPTFNGMYFTKLAPPPGSTGRYGEVTLYTYQTYITQYQRMAYTHLGINNYNVGVSILGTEFAPSEAYVPMQFWFCRNPGLALPLIALQYHEVKLNITFAKKQNYIIPRNGIDLDDIQVDLTSIKIFGEYIFLDSIERKKFAQEPHEYLIDQLQYQSLDTVNSSSIELNFNHPVKELIFIGKPQNVINSLSKNTYPDNPNYPSGYKDVWGGATPYPIILNDNNTYAGASTDIKIQLILNQNDRFSARNLKYFTRNQILENHKGSGSIHGNYDSIGVYSFSLSPEEYQPSGSCNFSRIDRALLTFQDRKPTETLNPLNIYGINYNVLRIMSGMGGLAYSN